MSTLSTLGYILFSFLFWLIFYLSTFLIPYKNYFHLAKPLKKNEFHCRIVTFIHAAVAVSASAWSIFVHRSWPYSDPVVENTNLQEWICISSTGYFLFDLAWCLYHKAEGFVMLFHHCLTMFGLWVTLYRGVHGSEIIATMFMAEVTNPILQFRWFVLNLNANSKKSSNGQLNGKDKTIFQNDYNNNEELKQNSNINNSCNNNSNLISNYEKVGGQKTDLQNEDAKLKDKNIAFVDFLFFTLFTVMRLIMGSIFLIYYLSFDKPDKLARFGCVLIYAVSWLFWLQMVKYLRKTYFVKQKSN